MDKFNNLSLAELAEKLAKVDKEIEREKDLLGKAKNAHFQDGEVWLLYNKQYKRIDKIVDEHTKKLLFNKKQIELVRKSLEKITAFRKVRNALLLEKVKLELNTELYKGIVDFDDNSNGYLSYNFRIEDIKEYGNKLPEEQKYKYYARLETELDRIINAFNNSEFKRFDGNMYFGLIDFLDSVEYIIEKEKCLELEILVREKIKNLDIYTEEKDFKRVIMMIDFDITLLPGRLAKTRELLGYEINYLQKILVIDTKQIKNEKVIDKKKEFDLGKEIDRIFDDITKADSVEEKIYNEIELWRNFSNEPPDNLWLGDKRDIAAGMLKPTVNILEKAKITGYIKEKKIDFEAAERLSKYLKNVLEDLIDRNNLVEADEAILLEGEMEENLLRKFKRGDLQKALKKYIKQFHLKEGVTVESKKVALITRKLINAGWDAKIQNVAVTLRKMGYGEERKKW